MLDTEHSAKIVRLEEKVKYLEERTAKSENEITELKGLVEVYKASTGQVKNKLDQIYTALIGDEMGNTGLVKRVAVLEKFIEMITQKKAYILGGLAAIGAMAGAAYWLMNQLLTWIK